MAGDEAVTTSQLHQARYHVEALADARMLIAEPTRKGVATRYRLAETAPETSDDEQPDSDLFSEV